MTDETDETPYPGPLDVPWVPETLARRAARVEQLLGGPPPAFRAGGRCLPCEELATAIRFRGHVARRCDQPAHPCRCWWCGRAKFHSEACPDRVRTGGE